MSADGPYKVAAVQAEPCWLDADAGVEKATALIAEAASNGARLVAFPELWIPGYPHFLWIDAQAMGMRFVPQYHANSIVVGDSRFNRLAKAAADNEITVVMGASERDFGSLYMAQFILGDDSEVLFTRRKHEGSPPCRATRTGFLPRGAPGGLSESPIQGRRSRVQSLLVSRSET